MTDIDWPDDLPAPRVEFTGSVLPSVVRTEMDSGRSRQRQRFSARQEQYNFEFIFTNEGYEEFIEFYENEIAQGAAFFNLPILTPAGLEVKEMRIISGVYDFRPFPPDHWIASMRMERGIAPGYIETPVDIMPLLLQRVITRSTNFTLAPEDINALIRVNVGIGETIQITLPANAGFTDAFSCGITKIGLGNVEFVGELGVVLDSVDSFVRIFRTYTPVTVTYVDVNHFQAMGSLY
jgi:hypothetical protein